MALDIIQELEAIVDTLAREGIDYALCGGLAVAVHGHPRATKDIDLLVLPQDVARVLTLVKALGFDVPSRKMTFRTGKPNQQTVNRISKLDEATGELVPLDLLNVNDEHDSIWHDRVEIPWRERKLSIVSREGLAMMKRRAGRPQDLADLAALESAIDDDES